MKDYKQTLNLPKTDFPMKANLATREPLLLKQWQDSALYAKLRTKMHGKKTFMLLDGPPYANGHIHVGHAVNKILKDVVIKSKTLSGYDAPFVPVWDCHGLPIELNVEKKYGKAGQKISSADFRVACRDYAYEFVHIQREEFKRLGVLGDWDHPMLTMDYTYEANIIRCLAAIIAKGHLQKGYKPVLWCLDCASSLAEAEVEYVEKVSDALDVRFKVADLTDFAKRLQLKMIPPLPVAIPIWTTTPWTLPANQAVALNPQLTYAIVVCEEREILVIAADLLETVLERYEVRQSHVIGNVTGEQLSGLLLWHPFYEKQVPVITGEHVTADAGTGAVHTAPAHGMDDYLMGQQYQLPLLNPLTDAGCFTADIPLFAGKHVSKINPQMIETLIQAGTLIHRATLQHSYPHCWRHKTAVIYRATPQWFISMEKNGLRQAALAAIPTIAWSPSWGDVRLSNMIEGRPDWCISRQRTWGVPLALFIHRETGDCHPDTLKLMEAVAKRVEQAGSEVWYTLDPKELLGDDAKDYQKVTDVLDVWFDSGVAPQCVLNTRPELSFPSDLVLEGSDQYRGWFQSQLLTALAMSGEVPYRAVLTHGFVVDAKGHKMSKSIGNVVAPDEVTNTLGADILRLWVNAIDYRAEITASKEILTTATETYRRIRNTARFLLANLDGFDPALHQVLPEAMLALDQWVVDKAYRLQAEIIAAYEACQFHLVVQKLHHFCLMDLGGFYLDIIKDRQYTMPTNSRGRRSAQTALFHLVHAFTRWMSPILSFTAEEVWQYIPGEKEESVFLTEWYTALQALPADANLNPAFWEMVRLVREAVNKEIESLRQAGVLGSALEAKVTLYCAPQLYSPLIRLGSELRFVLITSSAVVLPEAECPAGALNTEVSGLSLMIEATDNPKCERCWHRTNDVGAVAEYPGICGRCVENVAMEGENRIYA